MRRIPLAALASALVLAACSDGSRTTAPSDARPAALLTTRPPCDPSYLFPGGLQLFKNQLPQVFEPQTVTPASNKASVISGLMAQGKTKDATKQAFQFIAWILERDKQGKVINESLVNDLIGQLLCAVGSSALPNGIDPRDPTVGIGFYDPSSNQPTVVKTNNGIAGTQIEPGSLKDPGTHQPITQLATIVVYRLPDFPQPLNTSYQQFPPFFFYDASYESCSDGCAATAPAVEPAATVGFCLSTSSPPPPSANLRVGHNTNDDGGFEILPLSTVPFSLQCSTVGSFGNTALAPGAGFGNLAAAAWRTASHALGDLAAAVLLPEQAQALAFGGGTIGGKTTSFSPFGAVDVGTGQLSYQTDVAFAQSVGVPLYGSECETSPCPVVVRLWSAAQGSGGPSYPLGGTPVTVTLVPEPESGATGKLTGTTTVVTDANGLATFADLKVSANGSYHLTASAPGAAPASSQQFCLGCSY